MPEFQFISGVGIVAKPLDKRSFLEEHLGFSLKDWSEETVNLEFFNQFETIDYDYQDKQPV